MEKRRGRDYRAEIARRYLYVYEVAAVVGIHPVRLSSMLREEEPISKRIRQSLDHLLFDKEGGGSGN